VNSVGQSEPLVSDKVQLTSPYGKLHVVIWNFYIIHTIYFILCYTRSFILCITNLMKIAVFVVSLLTCDKL
jgi:hypothetical protein